MPSQRKSRNLEDQLCASFFKSVQSLLMYNQIVNPETFKIWHNDNGQRAGRDKTARMIAGARAKRMGVMRGLLDYETIWRDLDGVRKHGFLEAKVGSNGLTDEQEDFFAFCNEENIPCAMFKTVSSGLHIMQQWGIIKPTAIF